MLTEKENEVVIEGILSEINIREGEFKKKDTNQMMPYLSGNIKIRVNQKVNGEETELEIPVDFFASKFTNSGALHPAYKSINDMRTNLVSLAAATDTTPADYIRIGGASLKENMFMSKSGNFISMPIINASFFNKVEAKNFEPKSRFKTTICIGNIKEEVDKNGDTTGALLIQGIVPTYGGKVDVMEYTVRSKEAVEHISANWHKGDTVIAQGVVNFSSKIIHEEEATGFGEPIINSRTVSVRELLITSGSPFSLEGDMAFDTDDIANALSERMTRVNSVKNNVNTPKAQNRKSDFNNLGF